MSESKLIEGRTGQIVGQTYTTNTYATGYVPTGYSQNYAVGTGSGAQTVTYTTTTGGQQYTSGGQYVSGERQYVSGGQYASGYAQQPVVYASGSQQVVSTNVNTGKEVIKGESRIEYVPFEKKIIEYKDQASVERVPKTRKIVEYKEERKVETIPKEVTVTDYYAVEYLRQYIPQYVPEKRIEYVQVPKKQIRYEYIPVERQIVHYPEQPLEAERVGYAQQSGYVQGGYTTTNVAYNAPSTVTTKEVVYQNVPATSNIVSGNTVTYQTRDIPTSSVVPTSTVAYSGNNVSYQTKEVPVGYYQVEEPSTVTRTQYVSGYPAESYYTSGYTTGNQGYTTGNQAYTTTTGGNQGYEVYRTSETYQQ